MQSIVAKTSTRVPDHTSEKLNEQIRQMTIERLESVGADPQKIETRLKELDREWDIERAIEANASTLLLASLTLGSTVDKRWFIFSGVVAGFLLQHAVQGWCPPVPVLRRLGFRTQREIDDERAILKARRGDFEAVKAASSELAVSLV